jgi:DNA-binding beta-propeller fold protein YncE
MQVTKLDPAGRVLLKLGKPGQGAGLADLDIFDSPTGVAVASNGDIYISEGHGEGKVNNSRIMVFTADGKFIKTFAKRGTGDGQLFSPHALAFDSNDHLYVADRGNSRVVVFDKDGNSSPPGNNSAGRAALPSTKTICCMSSIPSPRTRPVPRTTIRVAGAASASEA